MNPGYRPHPLDECVHYVMHAIHQTQGAFASRVAFDLDHGKDASESIRRTPTQATQYLTRGLGWAWPVGWKHAAEKIVTSIIKHSGISRPVQTFADYSQPAPFVWPGQYRPYDPANPIPRATWEHLAEHEANLGAVSPTEYIQRYTDNRVPPLAHIVDEHIKIACRNTVASIYERGFGVREAVRALRRDFPDFTDFRLVNIARTEGATVYGIGNAAKYVSDGLVQGWKWDDIEDSRECPICEWFHAKCFKDDDESAPVPPLHYQCRCTLDPILFNETGIDWCEEKPPDDQAPLEGFGILDRTLLPPRQTADELFATLSRAA